MPYDRKHPVHLPYIDRHDMPVIIFVTVCSRNRSPALANKTFEAVARGVWLSCTTWCVGPYLIMPDHVHFFCSPKYEAEPLRHWIAFWKRCVTRAMQLQHGFWQRDFWDTQMRSQQDYEEKYAYVRENPVRKGLVNCTEEWPYQGILTHLV